MGVQPIFIRSVREASASKLNLLLWPAIMIVSFLVLAQVFAEGGAEDFYFQITQGNWLYFALNYLLAATISLPVVRGEAADGLLNTCVLFPVSRETYFAVRVLGKLTIAGLVWIVFSGLVLGLFLLFSPSVPPGAIWTLAAGVFPLACGVASLSAIAPLGRGRYGHIPLWAGFLLLVHQIHEYSTNGAMGFFKSVAAGVYWLTGPVFFGPSFENWRDCAFGGLFFTRAVLQGVSGLIAALLVGAWLFGRVEVSGR